MTTFTNAWTETIPANADQANVAAAEIRKLRLDIRERMEVLFGTTHWDDDPLIVYVLNMAITGLAAILAGTTGLDIRKADNSASIFKIDDSGNVTLKAGSLVQSDLTIDVGHTLTSKSNTVVDTAQARVKRYDASASSTITWNNGNNQHYDLTTNVTFTFSNPLAGAWYFLELKQTGAGSFTVTWPAAVVWSSATAPTLTTTTGRTDYVSLYYDGAKYAGFVVGQNYNV